MNNKFKKNLKTEVKVSNHTPTSEQQDIIDAAKTGTNLAIHAFAGTGKTSTCVLVAQNLLKKSLYVAFNKDIVTEAEARFPTHVEPRTMHSLAYRVVVTSHMRFRLQNFFDFKDIDCSDLVRLSPDTVQEIRVEVIRIVKGFCQSASYDIRTYAEEEEGIIDGNILDTIENFWLDIVKPTSKVKITHDVYLKIFHLSTPVLPYDVIYLDEAQDSNPVTLDIVLKQKAQIILVGDKYQAIYAWRGAINAMENLPGTFKSKYLTESFRFTQEIADKATKLLKLVGNKQKIIGKAVDTGVSRTKATIVRNNSTLLSILLKAEMEGKKVYVLADLSSLWKKMYHINALYFRSIIPYPDDELKQYKTYAELQEAGESIPELKKLVKLTYQLSAGGLSGNINKIKSVIVDKEAKADFTVSTGHKSKGLEWDEVDVTDDVLFLKDDQDITDALLENQTLNLIYVMITRAKYKVSLPGIIRNIVE